MYDAKLLSYPLIIALTIMGITFTKMFITEGTEHHPSRQVFAL